jgi:PAS domain S-box-containing protein
VHQPDRFGDEIGRETLRQASETGELSRGIELGPLGTLTLRVVVPWRDGTGAVVGFLEAGIELEAVIASMPEAIGADVVVLVDKEALLHVRAGSTLMPELPPDWDRFADVLVMAKSIEGWPEYVSYAIAHRNVDAGEAETVWQGSKAFHYRRLPIAAMDGSRVGDVMILQDVTDLQAALTNSVVMIVVFCLTVGLAVIAIFAIYLQRVDARLRSTHEDLEERIAERTDALRQSELAFRNLLKDLNRGVFVHRDSKVLYANEAFARIYGYADAQEAMSMPVIGEHISPLDRDRIETYRRQREKGEPAPDHYEFQALRKDGTAFWAENDIQTIQWHNEQAVLTIVSDVTTRHETQEALHASRESLARAQRIAHIGNWERDFTTGTLTWSDEIYRIYGFEPQQFTADYETYLSHIHPEDRDVIETALARAIEGHESYSIDHRIVRSDSEVRVVHEQGEAIFSDDGSAHLLIGTVQDITDRLRIESELRETEQRLQSIAENIPGGVFRRVLRPDGSIDYPYLSAGAFGLSSVHPDDKERMIRAIHESAETMSSFDEEHREVKQDGSTSWWRSIATPRQGDGGDVVWDGVRVEITAQKYAQQQIVQLNAELEERIAARTTELEREKERAETYLDIANTMFLALDRDGNVALVNRKLCDVLGYDETELLGQDWHAMCAPKEEARPRAQAYADRIANTQDSFSASEGMAVRVVTKSGQLRTLSWSDSPIRDENGTLTGVLGAAEDVTEQRKTELELRRSEARQRTIMDGAVDAVVVMNEQCIVESFSRSATEMFGYAADDVIGKNVMMLMPEPESSNHDGYVQRYLQSGKRHIIGIGREVTGRRRDGTTFSVDIGVSEVDLGDSRLFIGSMRDITERKRTEEDLVRALNAADAASQSKSEFLSSMSHELRTPLNAILGFAQLLRDYSDQSLTPEQSTNVGHIIEGGKHLLGLVNDILDLSRIEAGRLELSLAAVDVGRTVQESLVLLRPLAEQRDISLVVGDGVAAAAPVKADPDRLKQVLLNLLSNAVKYNRDKGTVTVDVTATGNGKLRLSVADTGVGIAEGMRTEVFRPFSRLGVEASRIEGTGIGLAISRQLVEAMGAKLDFESTVGEGSTFWVELSAAE